MNPIDVIRAFKQGKVQGFSDGSPDGNCVCIAWIKCAISIYGLNNVVDSTPIDNGFQIQLKDRSEQFIISNEEIEYANGRNGFILNEESGDINLNKQIYYYAAFCFAVMAKKADILKDEVNSFEQAVFFLNEGLNTFSGDRYLGLRKNSKEISLGEALRNGANVGRSSSHAFFTSFKNRDLFGKVDSFSRLGASFRKWKFKTLIK